MITETCNKISDTVKSCTSLPLLLTRITIGLIFIQAGYGKITHLSSATEFFAELGIPFPHLNAMFASSTELLGGILILLGLLTRIISVPLIVIMIIAILTAQIAHIGSFTDLIGLQEWDYIVLLTVLLVGGAGKFSVDQLLCKNKRK